MRYRPALIVLFITTFLLSACTVSDGPPATPTGATTSADTTSDAENMVTITFGALERERQFYEPLIDAFNTANPTIRVRFVALDDVAGADAGQPFDSSQTLRKVVTAADTAAIFLATAQDIAPDYLHDLTPLIDADPAFNRDDFYPGALQPVVPDGQIYLLPSTLHVPLLSYDKDLWTRRGLPAPAPDWTWDDLIAAAERLAEKHGANVEVYGLLDQSGGLAALLGELNAAGIDLSTLPAEQLRLDQPAFAAALERVAALADSGALAVESANVADVQRLIGVRQVGMWPSDLLVAGSSGQPAIEPGTTSFPAPLNRVSVVADGYVMSKGTQHPEAAWRWLSFLSRQPIEQSAASPDSASRLPARRSIAERSGYWTKRDAESAAAVKVTLDHFTSAPQATSVSGERILMPLRQALQAVMQNKQPATQALRAAQALLEQQLIQAQPTRDTAPIVVATPAPDRAAQGVTTITFSAKGIDAGSISPIANAFSRQHPEIAIDIKGFNDPRTFPRFLELTATSDCFLSVGGPAAAEITATLDLELLIAADASFPRDDYPSRLLDSFKRQGRLYGLPYQIWFLVLAYNQTAFDAAHLTYPTATWTLDDFLAAAEKLTSGTGAARRYGFAAPGSQQEALLFFLDRSGASATRGQGEEIQPNFTDPKVLKAIGYYVDLLRNDSPHQQIQGYTNEGFVDPTLQLALTGRVGMWLDWGFSPRSHEGFSAALAPLPLGNSVMTSHDFSANGLYISARTQHPDECWAWLKYLSGDTSLLGYNFPARRSVAASEAFIEQAPPGAAEVYQSFTAALDHMSSTNSVSGLFSESQIDTFWFYRAIDRAVQGQNLERELAEAQVLTEQFLACLRGGTQGSICATQVDPDYHGWKNAVP